MCLKMGRARWSAEDKMDLLCVVDIDSVLKWGGF